MELIQTDYSTNLPAHAEILKEFFSALFDPKDTVYIYPRLRPDSPLTARSGADPDELPTEGRVVSRRPSSMNTKTLARLHELNSQGYDIYFCVNPLIHPRRCQKGVVLARNILVEMDESDMETQMEMLERFRSNIVSATYSGSRSLHMIVKLDPPLWNPNRVGRMMVPRLKKGETSAKWPQYVDLANRWISRFGMLGETVDTRAARDYARLSRVPGFLHAGTGVVSTLEHLDRYMSWDWEEEVKADNNQEYEPTVEELDMRHQMLEAGLSEYDRDRICGRDVLFPELKDKDKNVDEEKADNSFHISIKETEYGEPPVLGETGGLIGLNTKTSRTSVVRKQPQRSFLDDMDDYETLVRVGLPGRGTRMKMHKVVFSMARVFNWSEDRLVKEWRKIIEANPKPNGTDKNVDDAIKSLLGDWRANKEYVLYLPDMRRLPDINDDRAKILESRLIGMGCKEPLKAARIVARVILPLIKSLPRQCRLRTVGIRSEALRNAVHIRRHTRTYKDLWEWMQSVGIVTCKNDEYVPKIRTRQYGINIALVLWLCGFRTEELVWDAVARNIWPELSHMRVINDVTGDFGAVGFDSVRTVLHA